MIKAGDLASGVAKDSDIRPGLVTRLHEITSVPMRVIEEFYVPRVAELLATPNHCDVATVTDDDLSGWEIKAARDSLARLPGQIEAYGRCFDQMTIVVAPNHYDRAMEMIPAWWGAWVAGDWAVARRSQPNPAPVDRDVLIRMLWGVELRRVLGALLEVPAQSLLPVGVQGLRRQLLDLLDLDGMRSVLRDALMVRHYNPSPTSGFRRRIPEPAAGPGRLAIAG